MVEYIEREQAISTLMRDCPELTIYTRDEAVSCIESIPAADVAPVIHGHWIICSDGYYPYCSQCKEEPTGRKMTKYCDHCGAKMDEKSG